MIKLNEFNFKNWFCTISSIRFSINIQDNIFEQQVEYIKKHYPICNSDFKFIFSKDIYLMANSNFYHTLLKEFSQSYDYEVVNSFSDEVQKRFENNNSIYYFHEENNSITIVKDDKIVMLLKESCKYDYQFLRLLREIIYRENENNHNHPSNGWFAQGL